MRKSPPSVAAVGMATKVAALAACATLSAIVMLLIEPQMHARVTSNAVYDVSAQLDSLQAEVNALRRRTAKLESSLADKQPGDARSSISDITNLVTFPEDDPSTFADLNKEWSKVLPPPPASLAMVFGSIGVKDFVENWVLHVQRIPGLKPYVVVCMDDELLAACRAKGFPAISALGDAVNGTSSGGSYVRRDFTQFRRMGAIKVDILRRLLLRGYDVLLSDADAYWLGDPWPFIGRQGVPLRPEAHLFAKADILVTSDCINMDQDWDPELVITEFNTGVVFLRSNKRTVAFVTEWRDRVLVIKDGHDQKSFNRLLRGGYTEENPGCGEAACVKNFDEYPLLPVEAIHADGRPMDLSKWVRKPGPGREESRALAREAYKVHRSKGWREVYHMWKGKAIVGILPPSSFLNGHTYFVQRVHEWMDAPLLNVHCTFQFGDSGQYMYGKRQRLREAGLWLIDSKAYYSEGNFLHVVGVDNVVAQVVLKGRYPQNVYECKPKELATNPVNPFGAAEKTCWHPARLIPSAFNEPADLPDPAQAHIDVQVVQRELLRNALALAYTLDRILILPPLKCYCDRNWWMNNDCRMPSAQAMPLPYTCPMDHVFDLEPWYLAGPIDFREYSFLDNPHVPEDVHNSKVKLQLAAADDQADGVVRIPPNFRRVDRAVVTARVAEITAADLLAFDKCGVGNEGEVNDFNNWMKSRYSLRNAFCSHERNPYVNVELEKGRVRGETAEQVFLKRLNCTGQPTSQRPVDVNPAPLQFCSS